MTVFEGQLCQSVSSLIEGCPWVLYDDSVEMEYDRWVVLDAGDELTISGDNGLSRNIVIDPTFHHDGSSYVWVQRGWSLRDWGRLFSECRYGWVKRGSCEG